MILCCDCAGTNWSIPDFANVIMAGFSLFLTYYIFIYQKGKDKEDQAAIARKEQEAKIEALNFQEQNIRLQWFKELIVQPHLHEVNDFYLSLHSLESQFSGSPISEELKDSAVVFIKIQHANLRKIFVDVLSAIDSQLHTDIQSNLDVLIDSLTKVILNPGLNLNDKATFDKEAGSLISYSRNDFVGKIYNYRGGQF